MEPVGIAFKHDVPTFDGQLLSDGLRLDRTLFLAFAQLFPLRTHVVVIPL